MSDKEIIIPLNRQKRILHWIVTFSFLFVLFFFIVLFFSNLIQKLYFANQTFVKLQAEVYYEFKDIVYIKYFFQGKEYSSKTRHVIFPLKKNQITIYINSSDPSEFYSEFTDRYLIKSMRELLLPLVLIFLICFFNLMVLKVGINNEQIFRYFSIKEETKNPNAGNFFIQEFGKFTDWLDKKLWKFPNS